MSKKKRPPGSPAHPGATSATAPHDGPGAARKPRRAIAVVRLVVLLVALAALVGVVATLAFRNTPDDAATQDAVAYTTVPAPTTGALAGEAFGSAAPGDCLTWSEADAGDLAKVDCAEEHLFEVASEIDLSVYPGREFGPSAPFPGELRFAELRSDFCVPAVRGYLGTRFDPYGKFAINLINPGERGWGAGERTIRCGLQHVGTAGQSYPMVGKVADQDQARTLDPGTCVGIVADIPADPVPCEEPHAYEVVAVIDLSAEFPGGHPALVDQDRWLNEQCTARATEFVGGPERLTALTLTPFWENVRVASWVAGTRNVNCALAAQVETGGFATITGSARGDILINGQPPAPAPAPR